jgi:hypothetical protein
MRPAFIISATGFAALEPVNNVTSKWCGALLLRTKSTRERRQASTTEDEKDPPNHDGGGGKDMKNRKSKLRNHLSAIFLTMSPFDHA